VIFNSYVSLPEGINQNVWTSLPSHEIPVASEYQESRFFGRQGQGLPEAV